MSISVFQWVGFLFGVLYIVYAALNKSQCWLFSIVSTLAIALEDFLHLRLYFDGLIQIFYAIIAVAGLVTWRADSQRNVALRISSLGLNRRLMYFGLVVILSLPMGYVMELHTNAAWPYLDGFTSVLAVFATFLMVYKFIDSWIYWIIIDIVCIYLYYMQGAPFLALLYFVYLILALKALNKWQQMERIQ